MNDEERFWSKIDRRGTEKCWPWLAAKQKGGYGVAWFGGKLFRAHRLAFMLGRTEFVGALSVLHSCDNPSCCNPRHLFLGTQRDNMRDMIGKGRRRPDDVAVKGTAHPATKFTEAQVIAIYCDPRKHAVIAKEYGVRTSTVSAIKTGQNWGHLTSEISNEQRLGRQ